jgi:hypothetical protein
MINYHPVHPQILDILIQTTRILNDKKINLNIHRKNNKPPSCTSSNPGYPDSDKK